MTGYDRESLTVGDAITFLRGRPMAYPEDRRAVERLSTLMSDPMIRVTGLTRNWLINGPEAYGIEAVVTEIERIGAAQMDGRRDASVFEQVAHMDEMHRPKPPPPTESLPGPLSSERGAPAICGVCDKAPATVIRLAALGRSTCDACALVEARRLVEADGNTILRTKSHRALYERVRVAEALRDRATEDAAHAREWGQRQGDEIRRVTDRLIRVIGVAAAEGVSIDTINGALASLEERQAIIATLADEAYAVIADGDCAESAAESGGPETGRSGAVDKRDALYNDPVAWLTEKAREGLRA